MKDRVFIITINGKLFTIVDGLAVTTDGQAIKLADQERSRYGR